MFRINSVYKFQGKDYRLLKIIPSYIIWIDLNHPNANPSIIKRRIDYSYRSRRSRNN